MVIRIGRWAILLVLMAVFLSGCSQDKRQEEERRAVDFTVVEAREIPQKLFEAIEKNKKDEIRMSYTEGEFMYLVRGYGEQKSGGYSISVVECTEDETAIWFDTRLLGPESQERLSDEPSYPCLVVKMEARDKEVRFQ